MEGASTVVHFLVKEEDSLLVLSFGHSPDLVVKLADVARSGFLQDILDSATDPAITLRVQAQQALHLQLWAEAVQLGEEVLQQEGADRLARCLEVR